MSPADLPEITEASLDPETFSALITDISELATVHQVQLKGAGTEHGTDAAELTISQAGALLQLGMCHGVQVTYAYDGATWTDTLLRTPEGTRLCRIQHVG